MPNLPVRRDDVERLAHDALDAARHPLRTARATVDAARHPLRTAQAAAGQLRTAVVTVAGRASEASSRQDTTPPPTDAAVEIVPDATDAPAGPDTPADVPPTLTEAAETAEPAREPEPPDAAPETEDSDETDEIAPGVHMPLTPRPHLSPEAERDIAGELDPDPDVPEPRQPGTAPLTDPGTAKAIRKEARRAARASDPASRRE